MSNDHQTAIIDILNGHEYTTVEFTDKGSRHRCECGRDEFRGYGTGLRPLFNLMWARVHQGEVIAEYVKTAETNAWDNGFHDGRRQDAEEDDGPRFDNPHRLTNT